jgi:hypothetical protein
MLVLPEDVRIFNVQRGVAVRAKLVELTRQLAASEIDGTWWKIPVSKTSREAEDDHHWEWRKLLGENRNNLAMNAMAVQSVGGAIEGATLYRIDANSQLEPGKGAVYVSRLATAPRNRPWLVDSPKYKGIGTVLLLAGVRHSYSLGLGGRVWLTSLPGEQTRNFYHKRGFEVIFQNPDGTIDFELSADKAQQWLKREGYL